jgi:hypothetical protein
MKWEGIQNSATETLTTPSTNLEARKADGAGDLYGLGCEDALSVDCDWGYHMARPGASLLRNVEVDAA